VNTDAEIAAARQAHANAMTAAAKHQSDNETRMLNSSTSAGYTYVETPSLVDDRAVVWPGSAPSDLTSTPPFNGYMVTEP
jgi:hypothetical protein